MDTRLRQYNQEQKLIEWAKKITERQESGMPIEKWCRERGISKQTYYRWQKRVFEAAQRQQQVEFAEVRTSESLQLPATGGSECEKSGLAATVRLGKLEVEFYHGTDERLLETVLRVLHHAKMKLYESMVNGFLDKSEFLYNKSSYSARITQLEQAVAALKEKRTDVMENRSERNRWIENFRRFSDLEELDRKAVIQLVQVITVLGKDELQIQFNYQDEYEKALALITPVQERMVV